MYPKRELYTWSGKHFGTQQGDSLFTHRGVKVGYFVGDVVYSNDGLYLGELKSERLVADQSRTGPPKRGLNARAAADQRDVIGGHAPLPPPGFDDFADPDDFR